MLRGMALLIIDKRFPHVDEVCVAQREYWWESVRQPTPRDRICWEECKKQCKEEWKSFLRR